LITRTRKESNHEVKREEYLEGEGNKDQLWISHSEAVIHKKMGYDSHFYTIEFAYEKLIFHLMKFGFKRIGDGGVVALSTSTQNPIPQEIQRWFPSSYKPKS
jgi:hypothetical protein